MGLLPFPRSVSASSTAEAIDSSLPSMRCWLEITVSSISLMISCVGKRFGVNFGVGTHCYIHWCCVIINHALYLKPILQTCERPTRERTAIQTEHQFGTMVQTQAQQQGRDFKVQYSTIPGLVFLPLSISHPVVGRLITPQAPWT